LLRTNRAISSSLACGAAQGIGRDAHSTCGSAAVLRVDALEIGALTRPPWQSAAGSTKIGNSSTIQWKAWRHRE
jgi:hypothetical protein